MRIIQDKELHRLVPAQNQLCFLFIYFYLSLSDGTSDQKNKFCNNVEGSSGNLLQALQYFLSRQANFFFSLYAFSYFAVVEPPDLTDLLCER